MLKERRPGTRRLRNSYRGFWAMAAVGLALSAVPATLLASSAGAVAPSRPAADCQPFSGTPCLLPFPNDLFTRRDRSTPTGLRLRLPAGAMPTNTKGQRISVAQYNRNDGFSPGSAMIVHVPGLDNASAFARTGAAGVLNIGRSLRKNQPIVLIDESTGRRRAIHSQLDANATSPQTTNLMIIPAKALDEGHTYVVALRRLRNASGRVIKAPSWFARLRDNRRLLPGERSQRSRYARIFAALGRARVGPGSLYEAWDFTVASRKNLTSRLLSIRDHAFAQLGDRNLADGRVRGRAPTYTVTSNTSLTSQLRDVKGTFQVPCYLITCGSTATTGFHYSSSKLDALPTQTSGNVASAAFECVVPASASASRPARISLHGHGLFGSRSEVTRPWVEALATNYNMVFCGTDWWGLASPDEGFDGLQVVPNVSLFGIIVDRLQQGVLNTLYLGRLMMNRQGLASNGAFQSGGQPIINTSNLFYYGNSQGGIEGGLTTAVAPDFRRAVIGATGIDYGNVLIQRSTDFAPLKTILEANYPDQSLYPVISDLLQQLWDRGDPEGYALHMTSNPLPNTPSHTVLMENAYGDFQVTMYGGAMEARTIGASAYTPALDPVRSRDRNLFFGIPSIRRFPFRGSAVEIWDSGPGRVQPPPVGNIPPTAGPKNIDPHEDPRNTSSAQSQISQFLEPNGTVVNVCGGRPCHSSDYTP